MGLKTVADAVCSKTGLFAFTHSVEACVLGLGSMGVNLGALGLRLDVVSSATGGDVVVATRVSSSWVFGRLQILVWCFL